MIGIVLGLGYGTIAGGIGGAIVVGYFAVRGLIWLIKILFRAARHVWRVFWSAAKARASA